MIDRWHRLALQDLCREATDDHPASPSRLLPLCRDLAMQAWRHTERAGWVTIPDLAVPSRRDPQTTGP